MAYKDVHGPGYECFTKHNYTIRGSKQSQISPDVEHTLDIGIICPRCKTGNFPDIEHGETRRCRNCHLEMTVYGNSLNCKVDGRNFLPLPKKETIIPPVVNIVSDEADIEIVPTVMEEEPEIIKIPDLPEQNYSYSVPNYQEPFLTDRLYLMILFAIFVGALFIGQYATYVGVIIIIMEMVYHFAFRPKHLFKN